MVAILVLLTIITCLTVDYFAERAALRRAARAGPAPKTRSVTVRMPDELASMPAGMFVGPGHSWMEIEPEGEVHIGVDRLPVTLLGGVDSIETVPAGTEVHQGDRLAVLHQGERIVEVRSPVDGVVEAANPIVAADPARVAREPFGAGWLVSLRPRHLGAALRRLPVAEESRSHLRGEVAKLGDFLAALTFAGRGPVAVAGGGLTVDGLAGRLPAKDWRELTERFF